MANFEFAFLTDEELASLVEQARKDVRYIVTDFSIELIVSKFKEEAEAEGDIYVPPYQRSLAWSIEQRSYFVESLVLRVPIPPVFFYDVEGKLEIVDGSQRIRSLVSFMRDGFRLRSLEKMDFLNGYQFSDLPVAIQRRLNNTPVRSFVLDQGTDESTRIDLFRRLNTSGKKLQDAEIRKGAYKGPFLDLVIEMAASEEFALVAPHIGGKVDPNSERQELVTRFFVYLDHYQDFKHDVRRFLDAYMDEFNKTLNAEAIAVMRAEFKKTMTFVSERMPGAFYGSRKQIPRVRFEAVSVGVALALRNGQQLSTEDLSWLKSKEFEELVRTDASNSGPKMRARIEFVRDELLGL